MILCTMPAVITFLLALPATRTDIFTLDPEVVISDGPWNQATMPNEIVSIGLSPTLTGNADENPGTMNPRNIGLPLRMDEQYNVRCGIRSWNGDPNGTGLARGRAFTMFGVYQTALRTDPTCGGIVSQQAWISEFQYLSDDPEIGSGSVASIYFTVHVENVLTT